MSQEKLGEAIGLTFQQVQKYERGSNRISAGTLYRLSQVLGVPVNFFFDCYDDPHAPAHPPSVGDDTALSESVISRREARLLRLWRSAPGAVADEMLSLLASLSPHLGDARDDETAPDDAPPPTGALPAAAAKRTLPRLKAETPISKSIPNTAVGSTAGKPRRRHGAVWDPTDIYRASKSTKVPG